MIRSQARKVLPYSLGAISAMVITGLACVALPTTAHAYDTWDSGCVDCHGDFNSGTYVSQSDATSWGTSLMSGHSDFMGSATCDVCHQPPGGTPRKPVYIGLSAGIAGYSPVSCLGCHGRARDAKGAGACVVGSATAIDPANCGSGAGLRKHHTNSGVTACAGCHTNDAVVVFGESVKPAYYFTPDVAHPNKPIDSCNAASSPGNENKFGLAGLDNDGDLLRDSADPDCGDNDSDGIRNGSDNCTAVANNEAGTVPNSPGILKSQLDADQDGYGNICDGDLNNSNLTTAQDNTILRNVLNQAYNASANAAKSDLNGSGLVTAQDNTILRNRLNQVPGPSSLPCAGTIPCPPP